MGGAVIPLFLIFVIISCPIFVYYAIKFVISSREMKRIESISRSPAMALISESCSGYYNFINIDMWKLEVINKLKDSKIHFKIHLINI